jgi:NAD(P)-dependent dehydrogenase (short-subunit alcohol dehydrogenase family)
MSLAVDLTDRVVLVTGGARGIGLGVSRVLASAGATVVSCGRSDAEPPVPGGSHLVCDVRDPAAVLAMVHELMSRHGRLDGLVNNAGGTPYSPAADASPRLHEKVVGLNLLAPLVVAQACEPVMQSQETGGSIVNISSVSALRPSPGTAAYGAAKAGLDSLTRSLAVEWAPRVRVNSVDVGLCRTEHTDDHYGGDARVAAIERTIPLGRMADPTEVGHVVAFLAGDLASYVSGAQVACHGGGEPPIFLHVE